MDKNRFHITVCDEQHYWKINSCKIKPGMLVEIDEYP